MCSQQPLPRSLRPGFPGRIWRVLPAGRPASRGPAGGARRFRSACLGM